MPGWVTRIPNKYISYNTNLPYEQKNNTKKYMYPSSILLESINNDEKLLKLINYLYKKYGPDKIIYGVKNSAGILRWVTTSYSKLDIS